MGPPVAEAAAASVQHASVPCVGGSQGDSLTQQQQLRGDVQLSRNSLPGSSEQVGRVLAAPHIFLVPSCSGTITEDSVKTSVQLSFKP